MTTTGATLMTLKREARAATNAVVHHDNRGGGWFLIMWFGAIIVTSFAAVTLVTGVAVLLGMETGYFSNAGMGWIGVIGGVGLFALAVFLFRLPYIITSKDKVLTKLRDEENDAYSKYAHALKAELATYGVDTTTMSERNNFKDRDYEFTARLNGVLSDIAVREFGDEIAFMVNGERIKKPVAAA